nr:hypothetical protein [Arsenicibacter rosenii]
MSVGVVIQRLTAVDEFRGLGAPLAKSAVLLLLSIHPLEALKIALVALGAEAEAVPSKHVVVLPYPTKSTIVAPDGHAPLKAFVVLTNATFPSVALKFIFPFTSIAGKEAPTVVLFEAPETNKYPPTGIVMLGKSVFAVHVVPLDDVY